MLKGEDVDRPVMEQLPDGTREWRQDGRLHRTDGPAVEYPAGGRAWYQHGKLHREGGPAVERANGCRQW